jgi:hypothetical protein
MNFAMTREYSDDPEADDINNEKFWQSLSEIFKVTREMLEESAEEMGIDLDSIDFEETSRDEGIKDKIVKNHACCKAAKKYYEMVDDFFESEYIPSLHLVDKSAGENAPELRQADAICSRHSGRYIGDIGRISERFRRLCQSGFDCH